ncbi:homeobox protein aristaless-like 4 [Palaemon carinicauda]|uniref:homeobox protein aristaless-like 4 n=1 Tax=Palaemon carinicauda TaxID=392227 RepID=UPI0035B607A4
MENYLMSNTLLNDHEASLVGEDILPYLQLASAILYKGGEEQSQIPSLQKQNESSIVSGDKIGKPLTHFNLREEPIYHTYEPMQHSPLEVQASGSGLSRRTKSVLTHLSSLKERQRERRQKGKRQEKTRFTNLQLMKLENEFLKTEYPDIPDIYSMSVILELTEKQIKNWFKNRRAKGRTYDQSG